jgi:hypothetical protein
LWEAACRDLSCGGLLQFSTFSGTSILTQLFKKRQTLRSGSWMWAMNSTLMKECTIILPECFMCRKKTVDSLIDTIYPGITVCPP